MPNELCPKHSPNGGCGNADIGCIWCYAEKCEREIEFLRQENKRLSKDARKWAFTHPGDYR